MIASTTTTGVAQREASGNSSRQNRIIPKVPILSSTLTSSTEVPGVALSRGVRQPGVHREHRRLDREGDEEAEEHPAADRGAEVDVGQLRDEVRRTVVGLRRTRRRARPPTASITSPPASENSRNFTAARTRSRSAVPGDEEVDRDQGRLEEDVEEEHVGGGEDTDREALERQDPREEPLGAPPAELAVVPRRQHHDGGEDDREHDQGQADAVEAQRVVGAEQLIQIEVLGVLHATAGLVADRQRRRRAPASPPRSRARSASGRCEAARAGRTPARPATRGSGSSERGWSSQGEPFMRGSPPRERGGQGRRRRATTGHRSGRSRSAPAASCRTAHRGRTPCRRSRRRRRRGRRWPARR